MTLSEIIERYEARRSSLLADRPVLTPLGHAVWQGRSTPVNDTICELQEQIKAALPPEHRHLVYDLDEVSNAQHTDDEDKLIHALMAHLPGVVEHILSGDADPTLGCCKR